MHDGILKHIWMCVIIPSYTKDSYNITAAWAVDREVLYMVGPFGVPLAAFGPTLGCLWLPLGRLWAPFGSFGVPLGSLGCLWGAFGLLWPDFGAVEVHNKYLRS